MLQLHSAVKVGKNLTLQKHSFQNQNFSTESYLDFRNPFYYPELTDSMFCVCLSEKKEIRAEGTQTPDIFIVKSNFNFQCYFVSLVYLKASIISHKKTW